MLNQSNTTEPPTGAGKCTTGAPAPGAFIGSGANPAIIPPPARVLQTVEQLCNEQDALTIGMVRALLFNRATNGLQASGAVIRVGRRLLLERDTFLDWLIDHGQEVGA